MSTPPADEDREFRLALFGIGAIALTVRLLHVSSLRHALGDAQILDAAFYDDEARYLIGLLHEPLDTASTRFANPGYSYVLALIYRVLGARAMAALAVQSVLGAGATVLLGHTARSLVGDRRAALVSAALWAVFAPSIYYDGSLLVPSLTALLTIVTLLATTLAARSLGAPDHLPRRAVAWTIVAGVCAGASALLRPTNGLLAVALAFAVPFGMPRASRRLRLGFGVLLIAATGAVMAPRIVQQSRASGSFVPISANGGMNLWVGNNRDAQGVYFTAPFVVTHDSGVRSHTVTNERGAYLAEAQSRTSNPDLSLVGASAFWRQRATTEILEDPARWLALEARKLLWFLNDYEPRTNASFTFLSRFSPILGWNPFRFGALIVLGACGLVFLRAPEHRLAQVVLGSAIVVPLATCLMFFVSGEYRHPGSPALAIAGGAAISALARRPFQWPVSPGWRWPLALALTAVACGAFAAVGRQPDTEDFKAYAESLSSPRFDGKRPSRADYQRAEALLSSVGAGYEEQVVALEALLLVRSNRAIQFQDEDAARALVQTAEQLWTLLPANDGRVPEYVMRRVRGNLRKRVVLLGAQQFLEEDAELEEQLALLGAHDYDEIETYVRSNRVDDARRFAKRALALAPDSDELRARIARLERTLGPSPQAAPPHE